MKNNRIMNETVRIIARAVVVDAAFGALLGAIAAHLLGGIAAAESSLVRYGAPVAVLLWAGVALGMLFCALKTVELQNKSPHFDLIRDAGLTDVARAMVYGAVASALMLLCYSLVCIYVLGVGPVKALLLQASMFLIVSFRVISAIGIMRDTLNIYRAAERRLGEMEDGYDSHHPC